jgi:O-antigen/teichoic acid export membrane protein
MGMSISMARLLIDHKDDRAGGNYGSMILTGLLVFSVQGILILIVGLGLSAAAPYLFRIPVGLHSQFTLLLQGLTVLTAAGFATRIFSQVLHAHQRIDISNYVQILGLIANMAVLWLAFELGAGVFSLLAASAAAWAVSILCAIACRALSLWPRKGEWGQPNWRSFREMFSYGTDLFWIAAATQLINSSQVLVASRTLGISAAPLWSVMTRPFGLVSQMVWRPIAMSLPAFAEMQVRSETAQLWDRYRLLFIGINVAGGFSAVLFAFANGPFVTLWTGGRMAWSPVNDWLLGLWLILLTQLCAHNSLLMAQKRIDRLKYVYLGEGLAFVASSLAVTGWGGFPAMIGCSIICTTLFTFAYGTWRIAASVGGARTLLMWQKPLLRLLAFMVPVAVLIRMVGQNASPLALLVLGGIPLAVASGLFLLRRSLPEELAVKLLEFMPPSLRPLLARLTAAVPKAP